jgi:hypothetical protein
MGGMIPSSVASFSLFCIGGNAGAESARETPNGSRQMNQKQATHG